MAVIDCSGPSESNPMHKILLTKWSKCKPDHWWRTNVENGEIRCIFCDKKADEAKEH